MQSPSERACNACGSGYKAKRVTSQFCSALCRQRAHRARQLESKPSRKFSRKSTAVRRVFRGPIVCVACGKLLERGGNSGGRPPNQRLCLTCHRAAARAAADARRVPDERRTVTCPVCRDDFQQKRKDQRYCCRGCRELSPNRFLRMPKASKAVRGYGAEHRAARSSALAALTAAGEGVCCIGGEPIYPGDDLHLDHTPDRKAYRGLACAHHNRLDGAQRGRARRFQT